MHVDRVPQTKPLLMFKGFKKGDSCCCVEEKRYSLNVKVIFNPKAYANTQNLKG